ncbi:molybdate ABC transporter substrate-binding protein [Telmatospirillum siberiense]|uniref:Molybdate ABC transporter substrate-binding protein n=1 Tax=Telmatospirillum siberiense TaxID=382514 RepID=A0A2N3PPX7_9PROT|nr:molybdate ABC transporter substrate-binding protein [Telmatospirillum siberiense]PKU22452.1 molybdate ABC transporter substrate-binding protein [Telmatospirillum siberiense]
MLINKKLTVAAVALLLSQLPLSAANATTNITVAVAANFTTPLSEIITAFTSQYSGTTVTVVSGATGDLETNIINYNGSSSTYDLLLAADKSHPDDLVATHAALTYDSTDFLYAHGYLELWTNTTGVNVSSGLPSGFTTLAIAKPSAAPYGLAATEVLANVYGIDYTADSRITQYSTIGTTYSAVNTGAKQMGFVARSQICTVVNGVQTFSGVSHYGSYVSGPADSTTAHDYDDILQYGVKLARSGRTADETTVLNNFVNFLLNASQGGPTILKYCYTRS